eukprot:TRINITY_DN8809_c0_g1_i1.p1 TRINITY_DN8809_c0_g1~~TRINITY_DN8809_c0_g1_i1.p1  ORF type:complete len:594 (-),score=47.09 TRINITY_DN8809_c0_g1_i1:35-1816(-)
MPSLRLFGTSWLVSSDDFFVPSICGAAFRIAWMGLVSFLYTELHFNCEEAWMFKTFLLGACIVFSLSIICEFFICYFSLQGTIMEARRRKHVSTFLYIHVVTLVLETLWTALGSYWVFWGIKTCSDINRRQKILLQCLVIVDWIVIVTVMIIAYLLFDREREDKWERRMKRIFCCAKPANNNIFQELGTLFKEFFKNVDLTPTDIAAGLLLVRTQQRETRDERSYERKPVVSTEDLETVNYFAKYAIGAYGWMLYLYMNLGCGLCTLGCGNCCNNVEDVYGDNCFRWNYSALRKVLLDHDNLEIVSANFANNLYETPYFIAVDHVKKCVIISVRGTLSFEDCLTDATATEETLYIEELGPRMFVRTHKGILQAAHYVKQDIQRKGVLGRVMSYEYDYDLVLVGHSLGAGTASLLAILLRPEYPNLKCIAYSPPGLLDHAGALYCRGFITSIVLGNDMIPRLCKASLENLRDSMIKLIAKSKLPKFCMFARFFCCSLTYRTVIQEEEASLAVEGQDLLRSHEEEGRVASVHLYPAGKILHIICTKKQRCGRSHYKAVWAKHKDLKKVIVSTSMMLDHMPDTVLKILKRMTDDKY